MKIKKDLLPKYYQLEQFLRKQITGGTLAHLAPLPNERELCETHGVSRTTVRNALAALESDGLIFREQGRGTYVKYNPAEWKFTLKGSVGKLFQMGANIPLILEKKSLVEPEPWVVTDMGLLNSDKVYFFEGYRDVQESGRVLFQAYVSQDTGDRIDADRFQGTLFIHVVEETVGEYVKRALQTTSAAVASEDLAEKMRIEAGQPVLVQKRIYFSRRGRPLQISVNYFPGDYYQSVAELTRD